MFCAVLSLTPRMLGTPGKYCQLVKILRKQLCMGYCFHTQEGGGKKKCIEDVDQWSLDTRCGFVLECLDNPSPHGTWVHRGKGLLAAFASCYVSHGECGAVCGSVLRAQHWMKEVTDACPFL